MELFFGKIFLTKKELLKTLPVNNFYNKEIVNYL